MPAGERPTGAVVWCPHGGGEQPCALAYGGLDAEGIHQWHIVGPRVHPGDEVRVATLPARTALVLPLESGVVPEGWPGDS